jgi:hypothetical protein
VRARPVLLALAGAVACGCGGPGTMAGAQTTSAALTRPVPIRATTARHQPRGRVTGSVVDDGCARTPCPLARPPLPIVARVRLEQTGRGRPTRTAARTTTDGQGRFTLRVAAGSYRLATTPTATGPTCQSSRLRVSPGADVHVVVSCG